MSAETYVIGVILTILAGVIVNLATIMQKKVINELPKGEEKLMKTLVREPMWLIGLIIQIGGTGILTIVAQMLIGPALVPGLLAAGLIVLALGSVKILNESLKTSEIIGIIILIIGILFIGLSTLQIDSTDVNALILDIGFNIRIFTYTFIFIVGFILCNILRRKFEQYEPILIAFGSGLLFSVGNLYISPLMAIFTNPIDHPWKIAMIPIFIVLLILLNAIAIIRINVAFTGGKASNLMAIQQVPIQISPIFVYFVVFALAPPVVFGIPFLSLPFLFVGIVLIIISTFLLGTRQAQMDEIK